MTGRLLAVVVGTRPEAVKMAPVIVALRACPWARVLVVATGQHQEMALRPLAGFGIVPDIILDAMSPGQSLADLTARLMAGLDGVIAAHRPDAVLAQGDTTSVLAAGMVAFYRQIPFAHVEAGLRTDDIAHPFPEEFNRRAAALVAARHFAPTPLAERNLLRENVSPERIVLTGNTGIDALYATLGTLEDISPERVPRTILLTAHRRENLGAPLVEIFSAARAVADAFDDVEIVCPLHPNPAVQGLAAQRLGGHPRIQVRAHAEYREMVRLLASSHLVLTDSGGLQEEAPALGKPVLVLRDVTERPEAVAVGAARCVGTRADDIVRETARLLTDREAYEQMATPVSPYGDGNAALRIVQALGELLYGSVPAGTPVPPSWRPAVAA